MILSHRTAVRIRVGMLNKKARGYRLGLFVYIRRLLVGVGEPRNHGFSEMNNWIPSNYANA